MSDLVALSREINEEHRAAEHAAAEAIQHARRAGELLTEAKQGVAHGEWAAWLAEHFEGSARSAQRYMRVAKRWPEIEAKAPCLADLSLAAAEAVLATPLALDDEIVTHADGDIPEDAVALLRSFHENKPWTHEGDVQYPETRVPEMFSPPHEIRNVPLNHVKYERDIDPRRTRAAHLVEWYVKILDLMPPVAAYQVGDQLVLADGWYRLEAAKRLGWSTISVRIYDGTIKDAQFYYAAANATHSAGLTEADLNNATVTLRRLRQRERETALGDRYGRGS